MKIEMYPFSFAEFIQYWGSTGFETSFREFCCKGGMPGSFEYKSDESRNDYLKGIYGTIINRDLISKYKIKNKTILEDLAMFLMDNTGNLSSVNSITNALVSSSNPITCKTIQNYIDNLTKSYIFYSVSRFDLKGLKYLKTENKFYLVDHDFRTSVLGNGNIDTGRIYEDIVYIELLRRGYDVYIGKLYQKEIDFVAIKGSKKLYI